MYKTSAVMKFAAAHSLRGYEGDCENLHGHNWVVKATLGTNELDEIGIAYDFKHLKTNLKEIIDRFDHQFLNDIPPFDKINATSENLSKFIFDSLAEKLPDHIRVVSVEVGESEKYTSIYEE